MSFSMPSFKNFILFTLILIASAAMIYFAIQYSSYKTRILILKEADKYNINNYIRIVQSDKKLNMKLYKDREDEKKKITELRNDTSYANFVRIVRNWDHTHDVVHGSDNKSVHADQ